MASKEAAMMVGLRPNRSADQAPSAQPTSEPVASTMVYISERAMPMPCWPKNVGSQLTNPKIKVLTVINTTEPTTRRGSRAAPNSEAKVKAGAGSAGAGGGKGRPPEASRSISCISASASAARWWVSSQRGLSGRLLRRYQTISAPTPAMTNIGRQPKLGITNVLMIDVAGKPATTTKAIKAIQRPREAGGTNSVMVE